MAYPIKRFSWLRQPSAWKEAQKWNARRRAMAEDALAAGELVNANFAAAAAKRIEGMAKLASQAALKRIQAETKAKFDQIANLHIDKLA